MQNDSLSIQRVSRMVSHMNSWILSAKSTQECDLHLSLFESKKVAVIWIRHVSYGGIKVYISMPVWSIATGSKET